MCKLLKEVTAYQDCKGEVHSTKLDAAAASIASTLQSRHYSRVRISRYDITEILSQIINSDEARSYFHTLIEDKNKERHEELTRAFCDSSKSC